MIDLIFLLQADIDIQTAFNRHEEVSRTEFYQRQPNRIVVAAIMDLRQDPASIRAKLFGREDTQTRPVRGEVTLVALSQPEGPSTEAESECPSLRTTERAETDADEATLGCVR